MAEAKILEFNQPAPILEEEDAATLAAIDRGVEAADEGGSFLWKKFVSVCKRGLQNPLG